MLHSAVVLFVISIVALLLGFGGIAAGAVGIAKILFVLFAASAVVNFVTDLLRERRPVPPAPCPNQSARQPT